MNGHLGLSVGFLLFVNHAAGVADETGSVEPAAVTISEKLFNFGAVQQGTSVEHVFRLTNDGSQEVAVKGVSTSCSCTGVLVSQKTIASGQDAEVKIVLDTQGLFGSITKPALIVFENPGVPPIRIEVRASVYVSNLLLDVSGINLGEVLVGQRASRLIRVVNYQDRGRQWRSVGVRTTSSLINAHYRSQREEIICTVSDESPIGPIGAKILVNVAKSDGISIIEIPVEAHVVGPLKLEPSRLFLGLLRKGQITEHGFRIATRKAHLPYEVVHIAREDGVEVTRDDRNTGHYAVRIRAPLKGGYFEGEIQLETNLREQRLLRIRYAGLVAGDE